MNILWFFDKEYIWPLISKVFTIVFGLIFHLFLLKALGDENIFTKILILPNKVSQIDEQIQLAAISGAI